METKEQAEDIFKLMYLGIFMTVFWALFIVGVFRTKRIRVRQKKLMKIAMLREKELEKLEEEYIYKPKTQQNLQLAAQNQSAMDQTINNEQSVEHKLLGSGRGFSISLNQVSIELEALPDGERNSEISLEVGEEPNTSHL